MSSAFGLIVVMGTWVQWSEAVAYYVNTAAFAFVNAKVAGAEISPDLQKVLLNMLEHTTEVFQELLLL